MGRATSRPKTACTAASATTIELRTLRPLRVSGGTAGGTYFGPRIDVLVLRAFTAHQCFGFRLGVIDFVFLGNIVCLFFGFAPRRLGHFAVVKFGCNLLGLHTGRRNLVSNRLVVAFRRARLFL